MRILFIDISDDFKSVHEIENRPRGGRVNSLFTLPNELAKLGHDCFVVSDVKDPGITKQGVKWVTREQSVPVSDILVANRGIGDGWPQYIANKRVLWVHDLPHSGFCQTPRLLKAFNLTVFMSNYSEAIWKTYYNDLTKRKSIIIPNGVDKEIFHPNGEKDLHKLVFFSAPNRGLRRLPFIFQGIKESYGNGVHCHAYSNLKVLHPNETELDDGVQEQIDDGWNVRRMECKEAGVDLRDPIPPAELAKEITSSGLTLMPTSYPEICSNAILQSLACGTPVITTGGLGSAPEWVKHGYNGMLTKFHPYDYMVYQLEMLRNTVKVLKDKNLHQKMIRNAAKTKIFSWEEIAWKWHKTLKRL